MRIETTSSVRVFGSLVCTSKAKLFHWLKKAPNLDPYLLLRRTKPVCWQEAMKQQRRFMFPILCPFVLFLMVWTLSQKSRRSRRPRSKSSDDELIISSLRRLHASDFDADKESTREKRSEISISSFHQTSSEWSEKLSHKARLLMLPKILQSSKLSDWSNSSLLRNKTTL